MRENFVINQVEVREVNIPYAIPFQISGGIAYSRKSLIIKLKSEDVYGYGESAPFELPFYSSETISTVKVILEECLIPKIVGKEIKSIEDFNNLINLGVRGNNFAKAGLETAYWDLVARENKCSIRDLMLVKLKQYGTSEDYLKYKEYILSGVSVGIPEDEKLSTLEKWIESYLRDGYQRIKLKIRPGWDVEPLKLAKSMLPKNVYFWPDANGSYQIDEHRDILKKIDKVGCDFIEQPLNHNDIIMHTELQKIIDTPICFDESLKSEFIAKNIISINGPKIWNIKIQRVGGLLEAIKIYSLASQNNIEVWGGTMPETGIGGSLLASLASFNGFIYPACLEPSNRWYGAGLDTIEMIMDSEGRIPVINSVGIGDINFENCEKYSSEVIAYN